MRYFPLIIAIALSNFVSHNVTNSRVKENVNNKFCTMGSSTIKLHSRHMHYLMKRKKVENTMYEHYHISSAVSYCCLTKVY